MTEQAHGGVMIFALGERAILSEATCDLLVARFNIKMAIAAAVVAAVEEKP